MSSQIAIRWLPVQAGLGSLDEAESPTTTLFQCSETYCAGRSAWTTALQALYRILD